MSENQPYVTLTDKYRPQSLEELIGQDTVVGQLRGMLTSKRIHRTISLEGTYGSGKTTTARMIARYLNCLNPKDGYSPCGECWSCRQRTEEHDDVMEINCTNETGIDFSRDLVACVGLSPQSNYRVYIFDEIQGLSKAAMSLWLKPFEEPPAQTVFILCTTDPQKIPETLLSRCMRLPIQPVPVDTCATWLQSIATKEGLNGLDTTVFRAIADRVKSHPRSALQALEAVINWVIGNPGKTVTADILSAVVEQSVKLPPEQLAAKWVASVLSGQFSSSLFVSKAVDDPVWFTSLLMDYVTACNGLFIHPDLRDPSYNYFYGKLEELLKQIQAAMPYWRPPTPNHMAFILETLTQTYSQMKTYLVDGRPLLTACSMRCTNHLSQYVAWLQQTAAQVTAQ